MFSNIYRIHFNCRICIPHRSSEEEEEEKKGFISFVDRVVGTKLFLDLILCANNCCTRTPSFCLCALHIKLTSERKEVRVSLSSSTVNDE
jgi:hypothetical protein